jgi:hypothetical protein
MTKLSDKNKQNWRIASLVLLILVLFGPWTYDVIYVPVKYPCNPPSIRLESDYCGMPLSGLRVIFYLLEAFISISIGFVTGTILFADRAREYLFILFVLLPLLPFFGTALVILKINSRRRQIFHLLTWSLAFILGSYWSLITIVNPHPQKWRLWGLWSYMGLTIGVLLLEIFFVATKKELFTDRKAAYDV